MIIIKQSQLLSKNKLVNTICVFYLINFTIYGSNGFKRFSMYI